MTRMFSFFLISVFSLGSFAQEVRENYNGVRALGMGGAAIAVVNDETALLYNPAGLGKLRDIYGTLIDPEFESSSTLPGIYNKKALTNPFSLSQVKDALLESREKPLHSKLQIFPSFVARNFGVGILGRYTLGAEMNEAGDSMSTFYQDDLELRLGVNLRLFDGRVKIGAAGKIISRIEINENLDPNGPLGIGDHASEGVGVGADVGIILTAPWEWLPTISAVVRDVGNTAFTASSGVRMSTADRPARQDQDIDVAVALFPIHGNKARSTFTIEYQKMKAAGEAEDKNRFYHVGYEWNYADLLFFRAGMNQRYWTAGMELASEYTQLQFATYGEDVGVDGEPREDRRYVFKFSFRF